ncbi:MAG TPA: hypothetical protein VK162_26320 [Streptosporangiaceae bacterium]|nr:hypothetical protein [Streptosporangiaceae bacterium]
MPLNFRFNGPVGDTLAISVYCAARFIDTTDAAACGPIVMNAPELRNGGQRCRVWLRHR